MSQGQPNNNPITDDALRRAVAAAQARVDDERDRFAQAEERLRGAQQELALLVELGRLRGLAETAGGNGVDVVERGEPLQASLNVGYPLMAHRAARAGRDALVHTVVEILREHGEPMPIRPLMAEVISRGASIPGRGEQANLISVITRVPEITRPQRGFYGLREWSPDGAAEPAPHRAARRTTRRRKAAR